MKFRSIYDIIGPIMLGPSSSHTAGAARIGQIANKLFGKKADAIDIHFYGSFAKTYHGHATDIAIVGGLLNMELDDPQLLNSLKIAEENGIAIQFIEEDAIPPHPNTVKLLLKSADECMSITGQSIGGGAVEITEYSGFPLNMSGDNPTMLILHKDAYGAIAAVTSCLTEEHINIGHMEVSRLSKGDNALMVIETDEAPSLETLQRIEQQEHIIRVTILDTN